MAKSYSREEAIKIVKDYFQITLKDAQEFVDSNDFSDSVCERMESANEKMEWLRNDSRLNTNLYERRKAQVYATGNKWAIENFNATH